MHYDPGFILHLFQYLAWADRAMLAAAGAVPDEEYYKPRGFSAGSIHNLLVHQMVSPKIWLARWKGEAPTRLEDQTDHQTRVLLEQRWPLVHRAVIEFVARQTEQSLNAPMEVCRTDGERITLPLGAMMVHVADHGAYHRGQLNSMLKLAGAKTVYTPYYRYALEIGRPA
jgi:uncharacterized damage-inducible protein DinB